jgi:formyl-CoA transferase
MLPGLDIMAQARGGLMSITGTPDGDPVKIGVPICDLVCAMYVALGVTAALKERDRSGAGQYLDVSLLESGVSFAIWEAGKYFATGEVGRPLGSAHQSTAPYQAVRSADGHITVGAVTPKTWKGMCSALGLEDLVDDERYADSFSRHAHRDTLIPAIEAVTTQRSTAELVTALDAAGVPCAPIADYGQVFTDDHLQQRGYFWDAPHPAVGEVRQLGSPMRLSRTPVRRDTAGPSLGADTRRALESAGLAPAEVEALLASGAAADPSHTRAPERGDSAVQPVDDRPI